MNIFRMQLLEDALDLRAARHRVIASNIANEETPGYRAKELRFKDALAAASHPSEPMKVRVTHPHHLSPSSIGAEAAGHISEIPVADLPLDENSVSLDLEMAKLSDNAMHYNTVAQLVAREFRELQIAIREGR